MIELNIHIRLKEARAFLKLNQLKVATDLNIQQKTVSEIENGRILNIPNRYIYYFHEKGIYLKWIYDGRGSMMETEYEEKNIEQNIENGTESLSNILQEQVKEPEPDIDSKKRSKAKEVIVETVSNNPDQLINSKDVTIKTLVSYVNSQEKMIEFLQKIIKKELQL